jgi:hypothetical protein
VRGSTTAWRRAAIAGVALVLAGCAAPGAGAGPAPGGPPAGTTTAGPTAGTGAPVLQVRRFGGLLPPAYGLAAVPAITVWADGRVIGEGPEPAIGPGPALPNLLERRIPSAQVRDMVDRAVAAGATGHADLGRPGIADATTTRIAVTTPRGTAVRDVYALQEGVPAPGSPGPSGLTPEQGAARARLAAFVDRLTSGDQTPGAGPLAGEWRPHAADRVAAVAGPRVADPRLRGAEARPWPGPALPGTPVGTTGADCVLASGPQARAVLDAARTASAGTPWTTADGREWQVLLRPLLPSESGCADLAVG